MHTQIHVYAPQDKRQRDRTKQNVDVTALMFKKKKNVETIEWWLFSEKYNKGTFQVYSLGKKQCIHVIKTNLILQCTKYALVTPLEIR